MAAEAYLENLTRHLRDLLSCGSVSFLLGCLEPELRHPALGFSSANSPLFNGLYGSAEVGSLLYVEQVRALCDLATQTGQIQCINHFHMPDTLSEPSFPTSSFFALNPAPQTRIFAVKSIAVAPLERKAGLLGLLLLTDPLPDAFSENEKRLLEQYLPEAAQRLEQDISGSPLRADERISVVMTEEEYKENSGRIHERKSIKDSLEEDGWYQFFEDAQVTNLAQAIVPNSSDMVQQKELDVLKSEFTSMVGHELRTPLAAIKGYAGILQAYSVSDRFNSNNAADLTPERQQQYLNIIVEQVNHLEVLIGDLLDVSRIQAGRLALRFTSVDIAPICQQVAQVVQWRIDQQQPEKFSIRCVLAPELPLIRADPDRVQQVLSNLLENAIKYSPDGGQIEVIAYPRRTLPPLSDRPRGGAGSDLAKSNTELLAARGSYMMHITVRDQGIGISQKQQKHLFKPFSRLDQATTEQIAGAGLGLYISHKLIEAMGGSVSLRSREGEGTSITFTLPLALAGEALLVEPTSGSLSMEPRPGVSVAS